MLSVIHVKKSILVGLVTLCCVAPAWGASFEELWASVDDNQAIEQMTVEAIRKLAEKGNSAAQFQLGKLYLSGEGVSQDCKQSLYWFEKMTEAWSEQGRSGGYSNVLEMCTANAKQGAEDAEYHPLPCLQAFVGYLHQFGVLLGFPKDSQQAIYWFTKAADKGNADAQHSLGWLYESEESIRDYERAIYWYMKAAEKGVALSQLSLAQLYLREGATQDYGRAAYWKYLQRQDLLKGSIT